MNGISSERFIEIFITALFIVALNWKENKWSSMEAWKAVVYIYTKFVGDYYIAIEKDVIDTWNSMDNC